MELPGGLFANSAQSRLLAEGPGSLRPLAISVGEGAYPALGATLRMVRTGEPAFELVFGGVWEEQLARDPVVSKRFHRLAAARGQAVAEVLAGQPWRGSETVVGVGAGAGALVQGLLARWPGLRGVVLDLPQAVAEAAEQVAAAGLAGRCQAMAGSYFHAVPAGGDVYVLAYVLQGWDDARAQEILGAVRDAIPEHGRLLVVEEVVAPPNQPGGKVTDLMLAAVGGQERTEEEWRALLADSGFGLTKIRTGHNGSILEAVPTPPQTQHGPAD